MRAVALNLRGGGGPRTGRLADYLCDSDADAVVAGEFVPGPRGEELTARLGAAGFSSFHIPSKPRGRYTVLLATRWPSTAVRADVAPCDRGRLVAVRCGGIILAGVYFNQGKDKATLFDFLLSRPPALGESCLVMGDMNTGLHHVDEPGATFDCADRFARLGAQGYVDLWRRQHGPDAATASWVSPRGIGYRIDHAFATGRIADSVVGCHYDHATRGDISDHSALFVDLSS